MRANAVGFALVTFLVLAWRMAVVARRQSEARPMRHARTQPGDAGYLNLEELTMTVRTFDPDDDPGIAGPITEPTSVAELVAYAAARAHSAEQERDLTLDHLAEVAADLDQLDAIARALYIAGGEVLRGADPALARPALESYRRWWVTREGR